MDKIVKGKSAKRNYVYNLLYQVFLFIVPLATTPYISRVIKASGIGQYSFSYSITSYFVLLASLGFGYYAQREIARHSDDKHAQSVIFFEIMICKLLSTALSIGINLILIYTNVYNEYTLLMKLLLINIASTFFDVTFFFQGKEEFGLIAIVNVLSKSLGIICIFLFVKNENDLWLYAFFQSFVLIFSGLALWAFLPKRIERVKFNELHFTRHIVPTLCLFIPTIATSIYTMLDKTLIGIMVEGETPVTNVTEDGTIITIIKKTSDIENGYYEQSEKVVKMAMAIITSLGTVMIPRNSKEVAQGHEDKLIENIYKALRFTLLLGVPLTLGLIATANNFSPWFFGEGFEKVPTLIMIFSPIVLIIGLSNVLGLQYLIPKKKDGKFTLAITTGAAVNLCLNLILIRFYNSYGAAIASVIAEASVTTIMFIFVRKEISFLTMLKQCWKYIVSGLLMFGIVYSTQYFLKLEAKPLFTIILILEGACSYFLLLLILRDSAFIDGCKKIIGKLTSRFKKKEK